MPPTRAQLHYDAILSSVSQAIIQDAAGFIAPRVFPVIPVEKQSDKYIIFDQEWFLRDEMDVRPPSTESAGTGFTISRDNYDAEVYGLHKDIADRDRKNADFDYERVATKVLSQQALQKLERTFVTKFLTTGKWGVDITGVASSAVLGTSVIQWSDKINSDPIADIDIAVDTIAQNSGLQANTAVFGAKTFRALQRHPLVREQFGTQKADSVTPDQVGSVFNIPRVFVARAIKATNVKGQTLTTDFIVGKVAWIGYVAPDAAPEVASAGYTFNWNQDIGGGDLSQAPISVFRMEHLKADRVETEVAFDMKVVSRPLGYFFNSVVA